MGIQIYRTPQTVVAASTITGARSLLLTLCSTIFMARDFKQVEKEIADASKIRIGLDALAQSDTSTTSYNQIILGLNKMCNIYNIQLLP